MTKLAKKTKHLRKHKIQWLPASAPEVPSKVAIKKIYNATDYNFKMYTLLCRVYFYTSI